MLNIATLVQGQFCLFFNSTKLVRRTTKVASYYWQYCSNRKEEIDTAESTALHTTQLMFKKENTGINAHMGPLNLWPLPRSPLDFRMVSIKAQK